MSRLDAKTKALIERRFVAQGEERARRRKFHHRLFLIGFITGCCGFIIHVINRHVLHSPILAFVGVACVLIWAVCLLIYTGGHIIPTTFSKDADLRWHMNPWKDALDNLKEEANVAEALALLAGPRLLSFACAFVVAIFR
jgi:hypothetical protein